MSALVCRKTGRRYPVDQPIWKSDADGLLDLEFQPRFELDRIRTRLPTMWRYREALPIGRDEHIVSFGEGFTPLVPINWNGREVLLKLEYLFPSGSYKDRGASVLISRARELGVTQVVEDSSGNAGAAIAAYSARAGITCEVYVPESTSPAKLAQIAAYGATVRGVRGSREEAASAAWQAAQSLYYASHVWNPYFFHGTKTFAFEVVEQLGWRPPDVVVIPTGNGTLLYGAYLGFCELRDAGVIERLPRLIGVQAANCAPLCHAWQGGGASIAEIVATETVAEGIAIARPARAQQCLEAVRATGGWFVTVSEDEIVGALRAIHHRGIYCEPTSATALAALDKFEVSGAIVTPITGHGLKTAEKAGAAMSR